MDEITRAHAEHFILSIASRKSPPKKKKPDAQPPGPRPMTGRGVNFYLRALRAIFNIAKQWNAIEANPWTSVEKLHEAAIRPRIMKRDELTRFFKAVKEKEPEYLPLFLFYLFPGMRRAEALALEWPDVDFDSGCVIVHGKGDKYRIVPMMPIVKRILLVRRASARPFEWDGSTVGHVFCRMRDKAGIHGVKLHDLRKTFTTMLADYGISDFFIQSWLGHSDGNVTRIHYIGFNDEATREKMQQFERQLPLEKIGELI
jgi:integrase